MHLKRHWFLKEEVLNTKKHGCSRDRLVRDQDRGPQNFSKTKTEIGLGPAVGFETDKVRDQDRDRKKLLHHWLFKFFEKKLWGLIFAHKLVLSQYKFSQMTNCLGRSDYAIKTSR